MYNGFQKRDIAKRNVSWAANHHRMISGSCDTKDWDNEWWWCCWKI